jgi:hypothetical protein
MQMDEHPFLHVTNPDDLSPEQRERYTDFWAQRTHGERLAEHYRLQRAQWGDGVFERGMDKTHFEVIHSSSYLN